ncbi:MAG TPA: hypothetical protein VML58_06015 [Burkholderiaceae bacterium]|nr:hypothetical protein [Burkholderiaceae bacterium]
MMPAPRHYLSTATPIAAMAGWLAANDPDAKTARIAARRSFVHVKRCFMAAVERIEGRRGQWLKHQVRHSNEAVDLWLLRGAVFDALSPRGLAAAGELRAELLRALEGAMPGGNDDERALLMAF